MESLTDPAVARHLFGAPHLSLVIEAVIAGSFRATVWVDDPAAPRAALLWDGSHGIYLVGAVDRPEEWRELLAGEVLPAGRGIVKADVPEAVAAAVLPGRRLDRHPRLFYRADPAATGPAHSSPPSNPAFPRHFTRVDKSGCAPDLPAEGWWSAGERATEAEPDASGTTHGFRVSEINACFDQLVGLDNAADVVGEIEYMWPSLDAFHQGGFGFVAHDDSTIASWCTAEYVSPGRCGIGIETVAAFQRRGLATATARAFLAHCATLGLTAHWDAWASNLPSIAIAERIGLRHIETYDVHVGDFGDGS